MDCFTLIQQGTIMKATIGNREIRELINQGDENIKKLHDIVQKSFEEEQLIVDHLVHPAKEILTPADRLSDRVARFGGSWKFIILFSAILIIWVLFNTMALQADRFDPYPFILMNLVLSCVAALQAPFIMMSQNRQEEKDRKQSENDYLVNLKAELEIRSLHKKIDMLLEQQIQQLFDAQVAHLKILKQLEERLIHVEESVCETKKNREDS
ncbi:Uncharacterized membrane protein [Sphingobacterium lactis]|uniref:Uncharacterized membrane protein n=2 Tax=Sphingobacterium lactis TaxID=797291 RepID=A0A1H6C3F8_9SPHI|nr:Uncharacterized membrane protein [Sphingobacterium lactis]